MSRARDLANSADNDISGTLTVDDITLSGNITVGGTVDGRDLATDGAKLDGVEANADVTDVTNVTAAGALMESAVTNLAQVKAFDSSDYATAAQGATADAALPKSGGTMTGSVAFAAGQTFDGRDLSADGSKLDGIESGATADQSAAEIKTAYESNNDTNAYTDAEKTKLSGIETGATADQTKADIDALNINADTLDGQHGSYYTGYADTAVANLVDSAPGTLDTLNELAAALGDDPNFSTTVTNNIATKLPLAGGTMTGAITFASGQTFDGRDVSADGAKLDGIESGATADQTITAGSGLTGGGTGDVTISHADTSSVSNSDNSGNTFIQDLTFDGYGHVTAVGTGTVSVGNGTLTVQGTGALGGSGTFTANQSANTTISISHDDTSSQSSVNNSGATVIQDVTLDGYGHVTGLGSKTMTLADLGYTGATNANYITNNNQLTNGAGYTTFTANQSLNTTSSPTFSNPNLTSALRMGGTQVLSSGRALTNISSIDATTAAAIGNAGVGGGGTIDLVADGSISAGDPVGITTTGKAKVTEGVEGSEYTLSNSSSSFQDIKAVGNDKFIIVYKDQSDNATRLRIGSVSGTTISWGTEISTGIVMGYVSISVDETNSGRFCMYFRYEAASYRGYAMAGTISGTTISVGSPYFVSNQNGQYNHQIVNVGANKYLTFSSGNPDFAIVNTSGTSITSVSTTYSGGYGSTSPRQNTFNHIGNGIVMFNTDSYRRFFYRIDASGSTPSITTHTLTSYTAWNAGDIGAFYDSTNGYYVRMVTRTGSSEVQTFDVSSSNPSNWAKVSSVSLTGSPFVSLSGNFIGNGQGVFVRKSTLDTSVSLQKCSIDSSGNISLGTVVATSTPENTNYSAYLNGILVVPYYLNGSVRVRAFNINSTFFSLIGLAENSVSNGQTVTVTIVGGENSSQSGLAIGSTYGVAIDGTLGSGVSPTLGVATASNRLLLT